MTLTKQGRTRLALAKKFFLKHAGFSYDPKTETKLQGKHRCAREMAKAELWARTKGYVFEWQQDSEGCIGCDCGQADCACSSGEPHEVLGCVLYGLNEARELDSKQHLKSLWGICEPTIEHRRVVEAELALEQMTQEGVQ